MMRTLVLSLALGASVALPVPVAAQDLGQAITGIAQTLLAQELDRNAYAEAQRANTVAAYRTYLSRHPNGLHKADAEAALVRLGAAVSPPVSPVQPVVPVQPAPVIASAAQTEAALYLTSAQRLTIQRQLTALGHDTRGADGVWGANTRNAIARWQQANNLSVTGYVTGAQVTLIGRQAAVVPAPNPTPTPGTSAEQAERALNLSVSERREVQLRLTLLGHSTQGTNGTFGPLTRRAIEDWQRAQRATVTGYLTADQVRALQRQTGG